MYKRIITHADFDGVVSAAICAYALDINFIVFTQPRLVLESKISITKDDVVCDLPYPLECGLWFDHHEGNLEDLEYRKISPGDIAGSFEPKDSCARVVYEYFDVDFPEHFAEIVAEADKIDAFKYEDIEDWREKTPGKVIDSTIKLKEDSAERKWEYLRNLVRQLRERPIKEVSKIPSVRKRHRTYREEEERMLEQLKDEVFFLKKDAERRVIMLDLTRHRRRPHLLKQLSYLLHPESEAVLQVNNVYEGNTKTNNLTFSMSLSLNMNKKEHSKDIGEIMRVLNLGSGHPGAAAGTIACESKEEMEKTKERLLNEIYDLFVQQ